MPLQPTMPRLISLAVCLAASLGIAASAQTITVNFSKPVSSSALDGRILLLLSNDSSREPRMQVDRTMASQQVFGVTVDGLKPGQDVVIGDDARGYPYASLRDMPPGNYTVQAVLNVYQTFHRADGKTIKLAPDRGEGQRWNLAPGNLISSPRIVRIGRGSPAVTVLLDSAIPPIAPEPDSKYVRHIRIQSQLLTKFRGFRSTSPPSYWSRKVSISTQPRVFR
jgi:hypothetical protein